MKADYILHSDSKSLSVGFVQGHDCNILVFIDPFIFTGFLHCLQTTARFPCVCCSTDSTELNFPKEEKKMTLLE